MTSLKSLSPVKMNTRSDLLTQCLEFSQALENKGRTFKIAIQAGLLGHQGDQHQHQGGGQDEKEAQSITGQEEPEKEGRVPEKEV